MPLKNCKIILSKTTVFFLFLIIDVCSVHLEIALFVNGLPTLHVPSYLFYFNFSSIGSGSFCFFVDFNDRAATFFLKKNYKLKLKGRPLSQKPFDHLGALCFSHEK